MIFFRISKDIRTAVFNETQIFLNLANDAYHMVGMENNIYLKLMLNDEFELVNNFYISKQRKFSSKFETQLNSIIHDFLKLGIISIVDSPKTQEIVENVSLTGAPNVNWLMEENTLKNKIPIILLFEAFFSLLKVTVIIKIFKIKGLLKLIKNNYRPDKLYYEDSSSCERLAVAVDKASFLFPFKTKCLEWSATLLLMALKRNFKCSLNIGVQTTPFYAHAWIMAGGTVIHDSQELPQQLAVILKEPPEKLA